MDEKKEMKRKKWERKKKGRNDENSRVNIFHSLSFGTNFSWWRIFHNLITVWNTWMILDTLFFSFKEKGKIEKEWKGGKEKERKRKEGWRKISLVGWKQDHATKEKILEVLITLITRLFLGYENELNSKDSIGSDILNSFLETLQEESEKFLSKNCWYFWYLWYVRCWYFWYFWYVWYD